MSGGGRSAIRTPSGEYRCERCRVILLYDDEGPTCRFCMRGDPITDDEMAEWAREYDAAHAAAPDDPETKGAT